MQERFSFSPPTTFLLQLECIRVGGYVREHVGWGNCKEWGGVGGWGKMHSPIFKGVNELLQHFLLNNGFKNNAHREKNVEKGLNIWAEGGGRGTMGCMGTNDKGSGTL